METQPRNFSELVILIIFIFHYILIIAEDVKLYKKRRKNTSNYKLAKSINYIN